MTGRRAGVRFGVVLLATVLSLALTAALGFWQLSRASQKLALQAQVQMQARLPAWNNRALLEAADLHAALQRPVALQGHWIADSNVFLENRQMGGRNGFFLVTALRLADSGQAVLVQRGWVPRDFTDRTRLPDIPTPSGAVRITGRLAASPARLYQLGEAGTGTIRQNIDIAAFAQEKSLDLLGASVLQTDPPSDGLLREWDAVTFDVSRHYGYAFQWFALCALVAFLYIWFQIISPRRKQSTHGPNDR